MPRVGLDRCIVRSIVMVVALASSGRAEPFTPEPLPEAHWLFYGALRNDAFTELLPPIDDSGFTHDNVFAVRRQDGDYAYGGGFVDRWITSTRDRRRWDELDLFATGERGWWRPFADWPHHAIASVRAGPSFGGNFGGLYFQNGWHAISKTGPTVDDGLQNDYPDDRHVGFVAGGRGLASIGDVVAGYAYLDGQLAVGTGVSAGQLAVGASANSAHLGVHVELAVTRYDAADELLALPGGYGSGWQLEWRVGVHVAWSRFRVGYEYRANEGGSGEPIGLIEFQSRR